MTSVRELRFEVPLYTVAEAARIVGIPATTLRDWAKGYRRKGMDGRSRLAKGPVVTSLGGRRDSRGEATIPFVGLGESMVLAAVRATGVSMQRIRPALEALEQEIGVEHAAVVLAGSHDDADAGVQLGFANHLRAQAFDVEAHAIIHFNCEDRPHEIGNGLGFVGDGSSEEVDVSGRAAIIEGREQHAALEHEAVPMVGDGGG